MLASVVSGLVFSIPSQEIGERKRLRSDLPVFRVGRVGHRTTTQSINLHAITPQTVASYVFLSIHRLTPRLFSRSQFSILVLYTKQKKQCSVSSNLAASGMCQLFDAR